MLAQTPHPYVLRARQFLGQYAVELILIALIVYVCVSRGLTVTVDIYDPTPETTTAPADRALPTSGISMGSLLSLPFGLWSVLSDYLPTVAVTASETIRDANPKPQLAAHQHVSSPVGDDFNAVAPNADPLAHVSNLTLVLSPDYGERKGWSAAQIAAKKKRVADYIERYAPVARQEMRDFGIPASITLAQGILESNAGDSKLAVRSNNHFGIKCRKKCLGCTCRNYSDDSRYDMFRVFDSVGESYREHSELLNTPRYAKLKKHGTDYKKWAHGLKACGYATDKRYGYKLVQIIKELRLDRYDV